MISFSRILVGVDLSHSDRIVSEELSDHCRHAVIRATELAKAKGGEITFFTTLEISEQARHMIEEKESKITDSVEVAAQRVLEKLVAEAEAEGISASCKVTFGSSWEQIIREAIRSEQTLVIVGRRGSRSSSRFFYGNTVTKLIRKCPVPVLVAKPDPVREVEAILAADDFSEIGEAVLDAGVQLAQVKMGRLHVVHVIEEEGHGLFGGTSREEGAELEAKEREAAEAEINERLSRTDYRTLVHGTKVHVDVGSPEEVILDIIEGEDVDLMVIGSVGRSGLSAMLLGSTAERLLSTADASLMVIKPADFVSPVKVE